jgi:hypothetical protein
MLKVKLICQNVRESKILKTLEKFGKNFSFHYSVCADKDHLQVEFDVKTLGARNEVLRRINKLKNIELISITTEKVESNG